uniref:C-type lectin domain-containing protein n=1 Tax=Acrobeloides nanus TaxID=290746 RepID=A0A914EM19_9BILA
MLPKNLSKHIINPVASCELKNQVVVPYEMMNEILTSFAELEFVQAERVCNDLNGDLVSICDAFTNEQLRNAASKSFLQYDDKDFWLGLMNNGTNIWNWTNPSINCPYRNWANGEPNGSGSCASVSVSNGQWSSSDCTKIFNRTFYQAVDDCILDAEGAKLVSIHSDEENEFLIS